MQNMTDEERAAMIPRRTWQNSDGLFYENITTDGPTRVWASQQGLIAWPDGTPRRIVDGDAQTPETVTRRRKPKSEAAKRNEEINRKFEEAKRANRTT